MNSVDLECNEIEKLLIQERDWIPKLNEKYYFLSENSNNEILETQWINSGLDYYRQKTVIFKTKENAQEYLNYLNKRKNTTEYISYINEKNKKTCNETNKEKHFYIIYNIQTEKLGTTSDISGLEDLGCPYFETKNIAQYFLKKYKNQILKYELNIYKENS